MIFDSSPAKTVSQALENQRLNFDDFGPIEIHRIVTKDGEMQVIKVIDCDGQPTFVYADLSWQNNIKTADVVRQKSEGNWSWVGEDSVESRRFNTAIDLKIDPMLATHLAFNRPDIDAAEFPKFANTKLVAIYGPSREGKSQTALVIELLGGTVVNFDHRSGKNIDYLRQEVGITESTVGFETDRVFAALTRAVAKPGGEPVDYQYPLRRCFDDVLTQVGHDNQSGEKTIFLDFPGIGRIGREATIYDIAASTGFGNTIVLERQNYDWVDPKRALESAAMAAHLILEGEKKVSQIEMTTPPITPESVTWFMERAIDHQPQTAMVAEMFPELPVIKKPVSKCTVI